MALANRNILRTPSALRSGALTGLAQIVLALAAAGAGRAARAEVRAQRRDRRLPRRLRRLPRARARRAGLPDGRRPGPHARGRRGTARRWRAAPSRSRSSASRSRSRCSSRSSRRQLGDLITGNLPPRAADIAGRALAILVPAAFVQLLAALAASALAAIDSYGTAARPHVVSFPRSSPIPPFPSSRLHTSTRSWDSSSRSASSRSSIVVVLVRARSARARRRESPPRRPAAPSATGFVTELLRHARHRLLRDDDGDLPAAARWCRDERHPRHAQRRPHAADDRAGVHLHDDRAGRRR